MLERFLSSNSIAARFARTVVSGLIAVLIAYVPTLAGLIDNEAIAGLVVAVAMCVLSPLMGIFKTPEDEDTGESWTVEELQELAVATEAEDIVEFEEICIADDLADDTEMGSDAEEFAGIEDEDDEDEE